MLATEPVSKGAPAEIRRDDPGWCSYVIRHGRESQCIASGDGTHAGHAPLWVHRLLDPRREA